MSAIVMEHVTKDYGRGRGIFDVSLSVKEGEVFGFLGPNGAGKTTSIRCLLGFITPNTGSCRIGGLDCFREASRIQRELGYLAGEIAFPGDCTGMGLLKLLAQMKGLRDLSRMKELMEMLELEPSGQVRRMSKGMKQKLGIINAFMGSPSTVILDEPTSGLDPLMQNRFIELILEEKRKGTTILMSSHLFEEVERTCDRTAILRGGRLAAIEDMEGLRQKRRQDYIITLESEEAARQLSLPGFTITQRQGRQVTVTVAGDPSCASSGEHISDVPRKIPQLLSLLGSCPVTDLQVHTQTLEEIFLHYYGGDPT